MIMPLQQLEESERFIANLKSRMQEDGALLHSEAFAPANALLGSSAEVRNIVRASTMEALTQEGLSVHSAASPGRPTRKQHFNFA